MSTSLYREVSFDNPFLLSDGIGSSGKRLLAHVAGVVDGVEKLTHNPWFETVSTLHWLGELSTGSAVALLRTEADRHSYHLTLGREVNLRRGETTSIFSNPRPLRYVVRILRQKEGEAAAELIRSGKPIINEGTHNGLRSGPLFELAFGSRLILLHVVRHPADLALDWLRRGLGTRIGTDSREFAPLIMQQGHVEPLDMLGQPPGLYGQLNATERVLAMLAFCYEENLAGLKGMSNLDRTRIYIFEQLVANPEGLLRDIEGLIGRARANSPRRMFRKEGVPRTPVSPARREAELDPNTSAKASEYYERCLAAHAEFVRLRTPLMGSR